MRDFREIVEKFQIDDEFVEARPLGNGAIHHTHEIICKKDHYVLQEMNRFVFRHPADVMHNVFMVTDYIREVVAKEGGDVERATLQFIRTREGYPLLQTEDKSFYRMYRMIQGVEAMEQMKSLECAEHAAAAYGLFQKRLIDFDSTQLSETISRYHDTKYQLRVLLNAVRADVCGRANACQQQIMFVMERSERLGIIEEELRAGLIPERVTHNDTKCSNVLMEKDTKNAVCVIDLDTVMPGSALYDYGDAVRSATCKWIPDAGDNVEMDLDIFEAYTKGYLSEMKEYLTDREKELMVYSVWLMTMECGIRYLADYLGGDLMYSNWESVTANRDKAMQQFYLVLDIEDKMEQMEAIVKKYLA